MQRQRLLLLTFVFVILAGIAPAVSGSAQGTLALPDLTGSYKVSRVSYDLTDPNRDETFTPDPADKREIRVNVYYPPSQSQMHKSPPT
ncbi:MAG: hypothetical protein ABI700_28915 [Chloroflexota bacterium]